MTCTVRCLACRGDYIAEDDDGCGYCLQCRRSVFVYLDFGRQG